MAEKSFWPELGGNTPSTRSYHGSVTIGAAGAVGSTDIPNAVFTVTKNAAAGRYDFVLHRPFGRIQNVVASIEGPASSAFVVQSANPRSVNAAAGTFTVQLLAALADTDGASGYVLRVTVFVTDWKGF